MIQTQDLRVVVAGGGIVGLTTALAFRRAGADVVVCEQADQIRAVGTSIGIWQNAMSVSTSSASPPTSNRRARPPRCGSAAPTAIGIRLSGFADSDRRYLLIERGRLTSALADAVGHEHIRVGTRFVSYEEHPDRVVATFDDGSAEEADLLIGADGAFSVVRQQLIPGSEAQRDAGHEVWRALLPECPVAFDEDRIVIGYNRTNGGYLRQRMQRRSVVGHPVRHPAGPARDQEGAGAGHGAQSR